jgi:glycosyltransferase involved in cell wall biosynthesis
VKRATGAAWVADLRDPLTSHPHRRGYESQLARLKETAVGGVTRIVASQANAIVAASDAIAEEMRGVEPKGKVVTIANGCDFDDFAGLEHHPSDRFRIMHAGHFHGKRDPKPFLRALAESGLDDVVVRFAGDFRAADREYAESLGLGDRVELLGYVSRRRSLELQRDADVLLLLIPESGGRGRGVVTGKIFEYLAAERPILAAVPPDGAAAELVRDTGAGVVAASDDVDALREALLDLHRRWREGSLDGTRLSSEWRGRLSRAGRVEELADLIRSVA